MKNNKYVIITLVVMFVFLAGCGGKTTDSGSLDLTPPTETVVKVLKLPVEGFVGQFDSGKNSFVLATLPSDRSQKPGQFTVLMNDDVQIVDLDGNPVKIKDYDRVRIEKGDTKSELKAAKIVLIKSVDESTLTPKDDGNAVKSTTDYHKTPELLKTQIGENLPKSFPVGSWITQPPKNHPTISTAKIVELTNSDWSIYLLENPETNEKYSVTVTDRNQFEWTGTITKDDKVIQN